MPNLTCVFHNRISFPALVSFEILFLSPVVWSGGGEASISSSSEVRAWFCGETASHDLPPAARVHRARHSIDGCAVVWTTEVQHPVVECSDHCACCAIIVIHV